MMKKKVLFLVAILLVVGIAMVLASCGEVRSIVKTEIVNDELVIYYTDGTLDNVGKVVGEKGEPGEMGPKGDQGDVITNANEENWQGFEFHLISDRAYGIKMGEAVYMEEVIIPATYKGLPVTVILESGFQNSKIKTLKIPASITRIDNGAFHRCENLTTVVFEEGSQLNSISYAAFMGCSRLKSVSFDNAEGWWYASSVDATSGTSISASDLANPATAASYLADQYVNRYWKRS